jgi:uncharacterized protein (TIGR02757 family)
MKENLIEKKLNLWYGNFCRSQNLVNDFIEHDPVQFPRRLKKRADIEIAAFLTATIAWGRRDLILRSAQRMFALMETNPAAFVMAEKYNDLNRRSRGLCIHRTFFENDLIYFCKGFKSCYTKYGNLERLFSGTEDIWQGISLFREEMAAANGGRYTKHIANPGANSACKRINLALRWLVRKGPVDLGLWKSITPAALYIPLDVHVARTARKIGLLKRKTNDKKAVIELTEKLREFCPEDPVKYDFALFGM